MDMRCRGLREGALEESAVAPGKLGLRLAAVGGGERVEGLGLQRIGDRGLETLEAFGFGLLGGGGEGAGSGQRVGLEGAGAGRA